MCAVACTACESRCVHLCVCVCPGTESAPGRPAERGKWLGGAVAWRLTGGQTVGGDDHTHRTIITHDGGHRLDYCSSYTDYLSAGLK